MIWHFFFCNKIVNIITDFHRKSALYKLNSSAMKKYSSVSLIFLITVLSFTSCKTNKKQDTEQGFTIEEATKSAKRTVLPSWNDTKTRQRIINYVNSVTTQGDDFVPTEDRIAVFDNDGTLWSEKPTYFQVEFALYRLKKMAPKHPEWKKDKFMQTALNHDLKKLRDRYGANGLAKLMAIAQTGVTTVEFDALVKKWMKTARHPITGKPYSKMTFQPMLELLAFLRANDFNIFIVSGGDIDFMRAWATKIYGVQPENIIGNYPSLDYEKKNGKPVLIKEAKILIINDGPDKAKNIHRFIGKKPVIAFGNSDGDIQMLEWCASNKYKNLSAFIHHTDSKREWAYDRNSRIGKLNAGLDEANKKGWLVVDMKKDWAVIHPD